MIRRIITLCLLFILVYAGVHFWYGRLEKRLLSSSSPGEKQLAAKPATGKKQVKKPPPAERKGGDYTSIVTRNIFEAVLVQEAGVKKEPVAEVKEEPKETHLNLVLQGTVSGNERDARAIIIDEKEKKQDLYQVGDAVQGALITSIERGKVILEFNGRKQFLLIKDRKGGATGDGGGGFVPEPSTSGGRGPRRSFSRPESMESAPVVPHRRISFRQSRRIQTPEPEKQEATPAGEDLPEQGTPEELLMEPEGIN